MGAGASVVGESEGKLVANSLAFKSTSEEIIKKLNEVFYLYFIIY